MLRGIFANAKDFFNNPDNVLASHPLSYDLANLGAFLDQLLEARVQPYEQTEYSQEGYYDNYGEYYEHGDYQNENYQEGDYYESYGGNGAYESGQYSEAYDSYNDTAGESLHYAEAEKLPTPQVPSTAVASTPASPPTAARPAVPSKANKPRPPPPPPKPSRPMQGTPTASPSPTSGQSSSPSAAATGNSVLALSSNPFEKGGKVTEEDLIQAILQV
jgi:hypothetical protein